MVNELDREALSAIASAYGLGLVVLYGSRARGAARPDSDLDLGLLRLDCRRMELDELARLDDALSRWCGAEAEVADLSTDDALFRYEVISHGRLLHEARPGLWTAFVTRTLIDHDDIAPFIDACIAGVGRAARAEQGR